MVRAIGVTLLGLTVVAESVAGQQPELIRRSMEGPRLGLTFVSGARAESALQDHGLDPVMSQFGWHFEQQVFPAGRGPAFVIEQVLLVGAVEQRALVPSLTLLMGIRMPDGFEFGLGPNLTPAGPALAIGVGKSLNYGGVSIPINLALVRSPGALRTSILVGYAIQTSR